MSARSAAIRGVILATVLLGAGVSPAAAQLPAGPDFQVNSYTTGRQLTPRVGLERDGDFVVTWTGYNDGDQTGAFAQRYDASGVRRGAEFQLNSITTGYQSWPVPAIGRGGDMVVAWFGLDGIFARRFDGAGAAVGIEFRVESYTTGGQSFPEVARTPDGGFVVAWTSVGPDGHSYGVAARRFRAAGAPVGMEFLVNTYTTYEQRFPDVAVDGQGRFVIVWQDEAPGRDGSGSAIFGQRFDASGNRLGGEFRVNTYTTGNGEQPSVAFAPSGQFVVAWTSAIDGSFAGVSARRFDAFGNGLGGEFQVNTTTAGFQVAEGDAVAVDEVGNFVVAWTDRTDRDVFVQRFDREGVRRGAEFRVNAYTLGDQERATVAADAAGNLVVAWEDRTARDGHMEGVFARRIGGLYPRGLVVHDPPSHGNGNGILEPIDSEVYLSPRWLNATGFDGARGVSEMLVWPGPIFVWRAMSVYTMPDTTEGSCTDPVLSGLCPEISGGRPPGVVHVDGGVVEKQIEWPWSSSSGFGPQKLWMLHIGQSFTDVPIANPFYRFVETLLHNGVTTGCGGASYCPVAPTSREQMAAFVLVAKEGAGYVPPACTTPVFADVPASSPFCRWVEELARRGVVGGCGGGNYCPSASVSRDQMAVFVLRTLDPSLSPPACVPPNLFADVPETSPFCRWVEELANRSIITGCGGGNYCPLSPVTREQMGAFLTATFGLMLYGP